MATSPPAALLEATEELIAAGPGVGDQLGAGLRALLRLVGADRGDAGFVEPTSPTYRPTRIESAGDAPVVPFEVPATDPVVRGVMASATVAVVRDVHADMPTGAVRDLLVGSDTRSILVRRFDHHDDGFGLVCVDWVGRAPSDVADEAIDLLDHFVARIWSPLVRRSMHTARPPEPDPLARLTSAERAVVLLAARGLSYREIAARRASSVNTVGHQLRSARRKLGVRNTVELARLATRSESQGWQDPAMDRTSGGS